MSGRFKTGLGESNVEGTLVQIETSKSRETEIFERLCMSIT